MKTLALLMMCGSVAWAGDPAAMKWFSGEHRKEKFPDGQKAFEQARAALQKEYSEAVTDDDLWRGAIAGMLAASGRKWDVLLSPAELAELHNDMAGQFVGIGVEIGKHDAEAGMIEVAFAYPDAPAARAGMQAGDRVLKVDGKPIKGLALEEAIKLIRGPAGKPVSVTFLRDDKVMTKSIVREKVMFQPVASADLDGVAVIAIHSFNDKTPGQLKAALEKLRAKPPRGVVIDLRNNWGGLFERLIDSGNLLLPKGKTLVIRTRRGAPDEPVTTTGEPILPKVPLFVLINDDTASSAEMLAASLRANLGAKLIGKKTVGKWNMQKVVDLPNGWAMKFTTAVLKTPDGDSPDGKGLSPDLEVELAAEACSCAQRQSDLQKRLSMDPQLRAAIALVR